jgi:carboxymethylenebutenolidase
MRMNVKKRELEIAVAGQAAEAFLYSPAGGPAPGVLLLTDIKGIRAVYHEQAERLAAEGFAVLLPNVFFRAGRLPLFGFPFQPGEDRTVKRMQELFAALTPENQLADAAVYTGVLSASPEVTKGALGVVGYCFTGAMALRAAAACADRYRAAASFHGGKLVVDQASSPHLLLPELRAALHFGHAVEDQSMPKEAIDKLADSLAAWGGSYVNKIYDGALHGWTNRDSPIYNAPQAEAAFADLLALLRRELT